ncbi:MAG: response regulator [Thermodesulfobacteriota bacterium]
MLTTTMTPKPRILIVDDDLLVHKLLSAVLKGAGYEILEAYGGREAVAIVKTNHPDLIMLDIMMPEMNGFDTIRSLKSDPDIADIPVIFLSAKTDSSDKVRGLELGAADFVNKPFDRTELLARIKTHLKLKRQEEALREYSQNLARMVEERTQQLIHADRLASLGTLSAGMAHEINNPTTFITGNMQILEQFWKKIAEYLNNNDQAKTDPQIQYILREFPAMIRSIRLGADRITNIVAGLKAFSRKETLEKGPTDVNQCLTEALALTHNRLKYHIQIEQNLSPGLPPAWANAQQLVQVFVNLLVNSTDAIGDRNGRITITTGLAAPDALEIVLADDGPGIPDDIKDKIFDPFFTTKPMGQGTGLGLSITLGILQDHHGSIRYENRPGWGAVFIITLPTERKQWITEPARP